MSKGTLGGEGETLTPDWALDTHGTFTKELVPSWPLKDKVAWQETGWESVTCRKMHRQRNFQTGLDLQEKDSALPKVT